LRNQETTFNVYII